MSHDTWLAAKLASFANGPKPPVTEQKTSHYPCNEPFNLLVEQNMTTWPKLGMWHHIFGNDNYKRTRTDRYLYIVMGSSLLWNWDNSAATEGSIWLLYTSAWTRCPRIWPSDIDLENNPKLTNTQIQYTAWRALWHVPIDKICTNQSMKLMEKCARICEFILNVNNKLDPTHTTLTPVIVIPAYLNTILLIILIKFTLFVYIYTYIYMWSFQNLRTIILCKPLKNVNPNRSLFR